MHHALSCLLHASMRYDVFIFAPPLLPAPSAAAQTIHRCASVRNLCDAQVEAKTKQFTLQVNRAARACKHTANRSNVAFSMYVSY